MNHSLVGSVTHKEEKRFGWYTKRLAVALSFGYLILFAVAMITRPIPALAAVSSGILLAGGKSMAVANVFLAWASSGYQCDFNAFDDRALEVLPWALVAFLGWFQYFAIGFAGGVSIDMAAALKRRLARLRPHG